MRHARRILQERATQRGPDPKVRASLRDLMDLRDVFKDLGVQFANAAQAFALGYLQVAQDTVDPQDALVQIDFDGGANAWDTVALLKDIQATLVDDTAFII